jgi:hypothetical protein
MSDLKRLCDNALAARYSLFKKTFVVGPNGGLIPKKVMTAYEKRQEKKRAKCKGYAVDNMDGTEYECGYNTTLDCDQCKYGGGSLNPEAKRNQIK